MERDGSDILEGPAVPSVRMRPFQELMTLSPPTMTSLLYESLNGYIAFLGFGCLG
jgi:hypothetical protein